MQVALVGGPAHVPWANAKLLVALVAHNRVGMWGRAVVQVAKEPVQPKVQIIAHKSPGLDMNVAPVWALGLVALGAMGLQPECTARWGGQPLGDAAYNVAGGVKLRGCLVSRKAALQAPESAKAPGLARREVGLAIDGALPKNGLNKVNQASPPDGVM